MDTFTTRKAVSCDGTEIAYDQAGTGPAIVLVGGAFCDRSFAGELAEALRDDFTVVRYDRRGRGDSGDTRPYAVAREVEDLDAVANAVGGAAYVYAVSSGAMLSLEAAASGVPILGLGLTEPPYTVDGNPPLPNLADQYTELCASGRPGDAVALFMTKVVGQPPEAVEQVRATPMWPALVAMAPTLAYDATIVGDSRIPRERLAGVTAPALTFESAGSPEWLCAGVRVLAEVLPNAVHRALDGEFHQPRADALAREMRRFFLGG